MTTPAPDLTGPAVAEVAVEGDGRGYLLVLRDEATSWKRRGPRTIEPVLWIVLVLVDDNGDPAICRDYLFPVPHEVLDDLRRRVIVLNDIECRLEWIEDRHVRDSALTRYFPPPAQTAGKGRRRTLPRRGARLSGLLLLTAGCAGFIVRFPFIVGDPDGTGKQDPGCSESQATRSCC